MADTWDDLLRLGLPGFLIASSRQPVASVFDLFDQSPQQVVVQLNPEVV